jgi:hypothetical protein
VLPEDDANRQLANAFHLQIDWDRQRWMQVLPVAGGWHEVLGLFVSDHIRQMEHWPSRFMILLIDFDNDPQRLARASQRVPDHLRERVFILGVLSEPENLKAALRQSFEEIGSELAEDCRSDAGEKWGHNLLKHNGPELNRLRQRICPILFPARAEDLKANSLN